MTGLLVDGRLVEVPGVKILSPLGEPWNRLARGQSRSAAMGASYRPQMKIVHKTSADFTERIVDIPPPTYAWGGARATVEYWYGHTNEQTHEPEPYSGTHLVTGHNGDTVCTADLSRFIGWHAGARDGDANNRSWGHEIKEYADGRVHSAALRSAVLVTLVDTRTLGVQWQCPIRYREGRPLDRFDNGGKDLVGVFGHRDVTTRRGYHDPGDMVFGMLEVEGFERYDFAAKQDLDVWSKRQEWLRELGAYDGAIDGVAGPRTTRGLASLGYPDGIFALWRTCAERPPMPTTA